MSRVELIAWSALSGALMLVGAVAMIELTSPRDPATVAQCEATRGAHTVRLNSETLCVFGKRAFYVKDR